MNKIKYIAPSILSADLSNLAQQIRLVELGGANWIHCDIMDGHFVPNLTFGPILVKAVRKCTKLPVDVHLMIEDPDKFIPQFAKAGADYLTVHYEAVHHLDRSISLIKDFGVKVGVSINPATPVSLLKNIIKKIDLLLIMSVNPGFGGQSFIEYSINKIEEAVKLREDNNTDFLIEVDGGINNNTIELVSDAGCNVFVAGSSIFETDNITAAVIELKQKI
ncbi:MAG TPA: ribulose-phosphate 3-epimerase [Ignavibacteriaceae bacterium]|nr:ribulose-phosphate 3-epimerase [Ignavibacteriaceae bacterium]